MYELSPEMMTTGINDVVYLLTKDGIIQMITQECHLANSEKYYKEGLGEYLKEKNPNMIEITSKETKELAEAHCNIKFTKTWKKNKCECRFLNWYFITKTCQRNRKLWYK